MLSVRCLLVKVNKVNMYVSQRLPVSKNLVSEKEKGILQELFATRSAAQAFQNKLDPYRTAPTCLDQQFSRFL